MGGEGEILSHNLLEMAVTGIGMEHADHCEILSPRPPVTSPQNSLYIFKKKKKKKSSLAVWLF